MQNLKRAILRLFGFLRERKSDLRVFYYDKIKWAQKYTFDFFAGYISAQKPAYCHKTEAGKFEMFQKNNDLHTYILYRFAQKAKTAKEHIDLFGGYLFLALHLYP